MPAKCRSGVTAARRIEIHTSHKFSILAHAVTAYGELGTIVAGAGVAADLPQLLERYATLLTTAIKQRATRKLHSNVVVHMMGFFKDKIESGDKSELLGVIEKYRHGQIPLIVPITLLKHHLRRFPSPYIARQYYLNPRPENSCCAAVCNNESSERPGHLVCNFRHNHLPHLSYLS